MWDPICLLEVFEWNCGVSLLVLTSTVGMGGELWKRQGVLLRWCPFSSNKNEKSLSVLPR